MPLSKASALLRFAELRPRPELEDGPDILLARALRAPRQGAFHRLRALGWALGSGDGAAVLMARRYRYTHA